MKHLLVVTSLIVFSFAAFSSTEEFSCEVRTSEGARPVASKSFSVSDLTGTNSKPVEIGSVDERTISISFAGNYSGRSILEIKIASADGSSIRSSAKAEAVIGLTSDQQGKYLDVLCRETVLE